MADDSSDLSSLSSLSPVPSDVESDGGAEEKNGIMKFFPKLGKGQKGKHVDAKKSASPPPRKRSPSPPHEYVLADNPDIAFIVMFRCRFDDAMPKSLSNFGPQELETDISDSPPGQRVENFLCAVLGLLLNRKQDVKPGHYMRALEDAISSRKNNWPEEWEDKSPLAGGTTFNDMNTVQRLVLLRTLIYWSLSGSETVKALINTSYKQNRWEDDTNQARSVQSWGSDSDKRRYFLIEGLDDTAFRVYRESNPAGFNRTWWSVAGSIEELKTLAEKLNTKDGGPKATKLAQKMLAAIPRFEATEEKRRRREYRQAQKNRFKRPETGFSMYEGRTRGKRVKYTYSDEEDASFTDSTGLSARNTGTHTPAELSRPVTTASGRSVRAPNRLEAEGAGSVQDDDTENGGTQDEGSVGANGRPRRSAASSRGMNGWGRSSRSQGFSADEMDEDEPSEPELGDDEGEDDHVPDESEEDEDEFGDEEMVDEDELEKRPRGSLIVELKVKGSGADKTSDSASAAPPVDGEGGDGHNEQKTDGQHEEAETAPGQPLAQPDKERTPAPGGEAPDEIKPSQTPSAPHPTSLAFRGSPDKAQ